MTAAKILKELKALGNEATRKHYAKWGAGDNQFGVKLGDIRKIAKRLKSDHKLALALWQTGNIDARFLALLIIEPKELSKNELDAMVRSVTFTRVMDWCVPYVIRHHPDKEALRVEWLQADDVMAARAGWALTASLVAKDGASLDPKALLDRIEAEMGDAAEEVQWTMNTCLVEIGIHDKKRRKRAIRIGQSLGLFRDYPVPKGCTSPFAPVWIDEMVKRNEEAEQKAAEG